MTIIVWDGKTLAADRQMTSGYVKAGALKITKCVNTGRLIGASGNWNASVAMINWVLAGEDITKFPPSQNDKDDWARVLIIEPDKSIWEYERYPVRTRTFPLSTFHAIGSGREVAYGALEMGADAVTAVQIASKYVEGCGCGVDTLTLE